MKLHERIPLLVNMLRLRFINFQKRHNSTGVENVVVSLTSIPSRLGVVHLTVKSLLLQSRQPKKIILWLHESAKSQIPDNLKELQGPRFDIRFTDLDSPHCKLVPSLKSFPNDTIVTCDDDHYYSRNWLKALLKQAEKHPGAIVGQKFRKMAFSEDGTPKPYRQWRYNRQVENEGLHFLALGVGGILYPSGCLHADATNEKVYLGTCPKADDLWFKAMSYLNHTKIVKTARLAPFYELMDSQQVSLKSSNIDGDKNIDQWLALCKHYPNLKEIR